VFKFKNIVRGGNQVVTGVVGKLLELFRRCPGQFKYSLEVYARSRAWLRNHPVTEVNYVQVKNEIQP